MPTLLQINVDANNGSNGSIARDIGTIALSKGWKSYIAYGRRHIPCDSELIRISNSFDVRFHGLLTRLFDIHGLGSFVTTKLFIRRVKKIKPDIVHLHNIHGYFINYKVLFDFLKEENIPIVWTFHDCWPYTGHCGHFVKYQCDKWKTKCKNCPAVHDYPNSWFFDRSAQNFALKKQLFTSLNDVNIVTVSQWLQRVTQQSFFHKYPIHVIYDGIDVDSFCPRVSGLRKQYNIENKFILMSAAANWNNAKGWCDYLNLAGILPEKYVIMLIGLNREQINMLPKNVIGVPRVESKKALAEYYSMADILLNLSYQETFGMTTAEAMACGTPGISYNVTACPELITNETGIVVDAGNMKQVLQAIKEIERNGKKMYSTACREHVVECFNYKRVNWTYFEIYNDILKRKKQ